MRRLLALLVALLLATTLAACSDGDDGFVPGPGRSKVDVDTPDLAELRAETGMRDCAPGPGGGDLPELTLPCLGGGTSVDLSSLRGPLLLSFWYAGCEPCKEEMPALQEFDQQYGDRVPVIGVDFLDTFPASALEQVKDRGVTFPSLADPGGDTQQFVQFAKMPGMPVLFFVDEDGKITFQHPGGVTSSAEVADLVREHLGVDL